MRKRIFGFRRANRPQPARKLLEDYRLRSRIPDTEQGGPDDAAFLRDAEEGLAEFGDEGKLIDYVSQLNKQLARRTGFTTSPRRRSLKYNLNLILIILLLLLLLMLSYWVVRTLL